MHQTLHLLSIQPGIVQGQARLEAKGRRMLDQGRIQPPQNLLPFLRVQGGLSQAAQRPQEKHHMRILPVVGQATHIRAPAVILPARVRPPWGRFCCRQLENP